ncbi:MAG: hypothetical protein IKB71_11835 [Lentisphaeria bacterium]|nr:hypothetical protein [Lentisphaeria bacterium]
MFEEMEYAVPLTEKELLLAAEIAGMISKQITEKELELDKIKRNFRDSIADLRNALRLQLQKMETKTETRFVKLEIKYNQPAEGKKQIFSESGELYEACDMTDDDWDDLFLIAQEPPAVVLKAAERQPVPDQSELSDQSEESELSDQSEEESEKTLDECSVCGSRANIYHVNYGKEICRKCMFEMPQEKRVKEMLDSGHQFLFRACAGYGNIEKNNDTTNFRFIDKSPEAQPKEPWRTRSWGMGIWRPGDYRKKGSEAYDFYMLLCCNPNGQEN